MSTVDTITSMQSHITAAYNSIANKSGRVPTNKNLANLADSISSIGVTEVGQYGLIIYYDGEISNRKTVKVNTLTDFNALCSTSGASTQITIGNVTIAKSQILEYIFGTVTITSIPNNFLMYCTYLSSISDVPAGVINIGSGFLKNCSRFNAIFTVPDSLTTIGAEFLYGCSSLTVCPDLTETNITEIPNYFLAKCFRLNVVPKLPTNCTKIGNYFLESCRSYNNNMLEWQSPITEIGSGFLSDCTAFNGGVRIPNTVTKIGNSFMYGCSSYRSAIYISTSLQEIGNDFMGYCYALKGDKITLPASLKKIGNNFLANCTSLSSALTIPSSITNIGTGFLYNCTGYIGGLTVNCPASVFSATTNVLSTNISTAAEYVHGVQILGTYASAWRSALPNSTSSPYRKLI